jgi:hypothetical protein
MPPVGFEPTVSAGERPKIHALDRAAPGTYIKVLYQMLNTTIHIYYIGFYSPLL